MDAILVQRSSQNSNISLDHTLSFCSTHFLHCLFLEKIQNLSGHGSNTGNYFAGSNVLVLFGTVVSIWYGMDLGLHYSIFGQSDLYPNTISKIGVCQLFDPGRTCTVLCTFIEFSAAKVGYS